MIGVTGATGFVGRALVQTLASRGQPVRPLLRSLPPGGVPGGLSARAIGELGPEMDCSEALEGLDCLVHCAARVHRMDETGDAALHRYRTVNAAGSLRLAELAAESGLRRLVFVSSIKVLGERTVPGAAFTAETPPAPVDAYGLSKLEAETALARCCAATGLELVVIRPTLVHGPGAGGNLERLLRVLQRGWPLPLAGIDNTRSMLSLENLVDLLVLASRHPDAPGAALLAADPEPVSTSGLLLALAAGLGVRPRLFRCPPRLLRAAAGLAGRGAMAERLLEDLRVDPTPTIQRLGWRPPVTTEASLGAMAEHWLRHQRSRPVLP